MSFETERCRHGVLYTQPCPECVLIALDEIEKSRREEIEDMQSDRLPDEPMRWADE